MSVEILCDSRKDITGKIKQKVNLAKLSGLHCSLETQIFRFHTKFGRLHKRNCKWRDTIEDSSCLSKRCYRADQLSKVVLCGFSRKNEKTHHAKTSSQFKIYPTFAFKVMITEHQKRANPKVLSENIPTKIPVLRDQSPIQDIHIHIHIQDNHIHIQIAVSLSTACYRSLENTTSDA